MKYADFMNCTTFNKEQLVAATWGQLVEDPPEGGFATLPAPPLLMFDRIIEVTHQGNRGRIVAEQDVLLDAWFFQCHFRNDPVQPGCLGVDAVWQLLGFYTGLRGARGAGRALGLGSVEFNGQIRPHNKVVRYDVEVRRFADMPSTKSAIAVGNGTVSVDGEEIYVINDAKVGIFLDIRYGDYPAASKHSLGGVMKR